MAINDLTLPMSLELNQRPLPEVFNTGFRRRALKVNSICLADWLGVSREVMESEIYCLTWCSDRKWLISNCQLASGGTIKLNSVLGTYLEEKNYWLGHKFALRVCKRFNRGAVPALQQAFANYLQFLSLPKLSIHTDYDHGHICYEVENFAYYRSDYVYNVIAHDLEKDAQCYRDRFTRPDVAGRHLAIGMSRSSNPILDIRIFNAKDFSDNKDRALLQVKRLIDCAVVTYQLGGVAA